MTDKNINWDATAFFASLTETNKFAKTHDFVFAKVSGLDGFEEALQQLQSATAIIAVSDISQGYIEVNNSPHTRRVKTLGLSQSFLEYGLWQNFGTGKEIPRGNKGDIGRERKRKKKPWFSRKYYASVMNLRDFLSDNIAHEFVGVVAQALDDKYVRYNH